MHGHLEEGYPRQGCSGCKGPEVEVYSRCSRDSKEARMAGAQGTGGEESAKSRGHRSTCGEPWPLLRVTGEPLQDLEQDR